MSYTYCRSSKASYYFPTMAFAAGTAVKTPFFMFSRN